MTNETAKLDLRTLASLCAMAVVSWCATAFLLYGVAMPLMPSGNGTSMVFDSLALVEATSVITSLVILSWLPILLFARSYPIKISALLASISTWILLGVFFFLVDDLDMFVCMGFERAG